MLNQISDLHIADVIELSRAFRDNRTHHREHFKAMLRNQLKGVILDRWVDEAEYHQRRLKELMIELEYNEFYDEEIWTKVFDTISHKKRINNITFFDFFLTTMQRWNADPSKTIFF